MILARLKLRRLAEPLPLADGTDRHDLACQLDEPFLDEAEPDPDQAHRDRSAPVS
ncbi:MAG TPA: hypothetical protein VFR85_12920 [Anaeromyxobacteraceae bacterium]|nr:hypothetical protein [Anaeromyxobacteraceae bacterium]